jgi:4-hydroxybenzoate polyprenyltransferase
MLSLDIDKIDHYLRLMRFDKPIGTLLLLWPTLWSLWLAAGGLPTVYNFIIFILGVVVMRSAGCVINDYADRKFDGKVKRTQDRPIATGDVTPNEALIIFGLLIAIGFLLITFLNSLAFYLAFIGALLTIAYPFAKRYTWFPQVLLGATFGWCVPMAFAAEAGQLTELTWLIYFTNLIWIVAYDTLYAMVDREDDIKLGLRSTAILFGDADRVMIAIMQGMVLIGFFIIGQVAALSSIYFYALAASALLFVYQQWLIRKRIPGNCFKAFLNNNYVGMLMFLGILIGLI